MVLVGKPASGATWSEFRKDTLPVMIAKPLFTRDGAIPVAFVDVTGRPDVLDFTRVYEIEGCEGDNTVKWYTAMPLGEVSKWETVLEYEQLSPVRWKVLIRFCFGNATHMEALKGTARSGLLSLVFTKPKHLQKILSAEKLRTITIESKPETGLLDALEMYDVTGMLLDLFRPGTSKEG